MDVSKLKNDRTPIIIEPNIPKMIGSIFFDIFIYIFFYFKLYTLNGLYKPFNFLKNLPPKLNSFYNKRSSSGVKVSNKSKTKKDFDPVTNFDRAFEKYIQIINK